MPRRVRDFLVSWGGWVRRGNILVVWRLAPLYLMWCLWREQYAWSFEDIETSVIELKMIMFNTSYIYTRISTQHSPPPLFSQDFLNFFSSLSPDSRVLLFTSCVLGLRIFALFNEIEIFIKKYFFFKK
jgi:hypothetical protein